jgi:ABC-type multidrug transport system fused ATPase/permease subunit
MKLIKATGLADRVITRHLPAAENLQKLQQRDIRYQSLISTMPDAFVLIVVACVIAISQVFALSAPADFILFLLLLFRGQRFLAQGQLMQQKMISNAPSYLACRNLLHAAQDNREDTNANGVNPAYQSAINLDNVHYAYADDGASVLRDITLSFPKNKTIAIAGKSGAGKTTLIDILTGILKPIAGSLNIDGTPLEKINLQNWRERIAYVPQDPALIQGTLRDNIASDAEIFDQALFDYAVKAAHVDEFASTLPQGYDTILGDRGTGLSGGQKQRVALARALMRKPEILILDEATSALDNISEQQIRSALADLRNTMTIIIIAHRFSTIRDADIIYVMDQGRIVQTGTFEDLENNDGAFRTLAQAAS